MGKGSPIDVRVRESAQARELHVTACPRPGAAPQEQAKAMFSGIGDVLRGHGARIIQERILAAPDLMDMLASARAGAYAGLDDGVPPSWLVVPPGLAGPIAGAQVHAVAGCPAPEVLRLEGAARGRVLQAGSLRYVIGSNLSADEPAEPSRQAQSMLAKAERLLSLAGGSLFNVARTWMWLGDILEWYADFNRVRNRFFTERGLLNNNGNGRLPASTGIGIGPAGKFKCSMDLCGVIGVGHEIEYLLAGGNQGPASEYGSAFSRAAAAVTPAGKTVFVSGTAAVSERGETMHRGDARAQIQDTIKNVLAVLRDTGCDETDVVQAIVYCKNVEVEKAFRDSQGDLSWPHIITIADICRPDLLFEVEATAMPGAKPA